jgi:hypothetical protein
MLEQRESLLPHSQTPNSCNLKQTQRERDGAAREQTQREREMEPRRDPPRTNAARVRPSIRPWMGTWGGHSIKIRG